MNNFWNERFAVEEYVYGTEPNEFFKLELNKLTPGKLLMPGEGEGRNAAFAAKTGWEVTAFDSSAEARKKAIKLAHKNNVNINYLISDYENVSFNSNAFDAIGLFYTHMNPEKRKQYHQKLMTFLKPGGKLIMEGFSKKQINNSGGPKDINMLFSVEELQSDFTELKNLNIKELEIDLYEGYFHLGKSFVIRVTGIK